MCFEHTTKFSVVLCTENGVLSIVSKLFLKLDGLGGQFYVALGGSFSKYGPGFRWAQFTFGSGYNLLRQFMPYTILYGLKIRGKRQKVP